jgi:membrane-bound lytic murein transglycosylase D
MQRLLNLSIGVVLLGACATGLPPAPATSPISAPVHDSLSPVMVGSLPVGQAGTELLDDVSGPALDGDIGSLEAVAVTWDIDVSTYASHPRVQHYLQYFRRVPPTRMALMLERGARYEPMIRERFEAEGLPGDLVYLALIESGYSSDAVSRAYAVGMWQFMRGTADEQGLRYDWYVDERSDPEKATRAAAQYLKTLYERFENWHLALAAYNAGPGRVQRALTRSGQETVWDIAASSRCLPRETRDYVPLVLAAIVVARNPDRYGLEIVPDEPVIHETVTLDHAVDLRRVAEWTGASTEAIQALNPELRRWTTPLDTEGYVLKVPMGTADPLLTRLASLGPEDLIPTADYVVVSGDTLSGVAARLKVSRYDLADANYLSREAHLRIGQRLIVPRAPALARAGTEAAPAQVAPAAPSTVDGGFLTHRVNRGDTLYEIARRYRTTVSLIKEWNQLSSNLIRIGQVLTIGTR